MTKEIIAWRLFMDTNILLENGTNELEVLEFVIGNNHYGIAIIRKG